MSYSRLRVHHLNCACIQRLTIHGRQLCCHVLMVETPKDGLVLVDTGLGTQDYADLTSRLTRSFVYGYAKPKRDPAFAAINQIRALGFDPADVRHIVMTHMDLDHVGGLSDFPKAKVHLHAAEWKQCTERRSFKDKHRFLPAMWAHGLDKEVYDGSGEPWFGLETVCQLRGLPPEILMVPLFGHTLGHCGVAIQSTSGWMLHAGDAYFDPLEVKGRERQCARLVGLFQFFNQTDRTLRLATQARLRAFTAAHPEVEVFCAHNPWELEAATKPLETFSRLVGKNPDAKASLEGLLQLPAPLWPQSAQQALRTLKSRMGDGMVAMPFQDLLSALGAKTAFTKDKTLSLARTLESANVGFEPDVLSGAKAPKPEEKVVLFALPPSEQLARATGPYLAAALTLQLASAVASTDGEFGIKEMGHLRETVLSWKHLAPSQTRRLLAHLRLLMQAPASLTTLKKKFEPLDLAVKETIAAFMATVAQSDGEVSPAEVKMLEKVYKALGVDSKKVFSDVHAVASGTKPTAAAAAKVEATGFKLDPARIAALQKDTERVSALLANIFTEAEEQAPPPVAEPEAEAETSEAPQGLLGMDEAHTALARMLLSRPEWSRDELQDVAADLDLMLDGALEHINEAAFDTHDVAFLEGDDPVTVNPEILEKLEA